MNKGLSIPIYKLLSSLSLAMDYNHRGLMRHHQRVALITSYIAQELQLADSDLWCLYCSAVIHDAGTSTFREKANLEHFDVQAPWEHCQRGAALISNLHILSPLAPILLHHHDRWDGHNPSGLTGEEIPLYSRIIFLADRVDILSYQPGNILDQRETITQKISNNSGTMFDPKLVDALVKVATRESFWLDLTLDFIDYHLARRLTTCPVIARQEEIISISRIFAEIIDGKSPFTYRHSRLVAETALLLAYKAGFDKTQQNNMYVAGLLHDLGKLSIPEEILEKPAGLNKNEYNLIKQHTYITHQILSMIDGFEEINQWASYHHETLNGKGYPFQLKAGDIPLGSRIMSVADIFSALIENRPYRDGLPRYKVEKILHNLVKEGSIDDDIVQLLIDNYQETENLKKIVAKGDLLNANTGRLPETL